MTPEALGITFTGGGSATVKMFLLLTLLSVAPALVVSVTSFTRIVNVLSFLRQALGAPQLPPNPVLIGLALFLSAFIMAPTIERVRERSVDPYLDDTIDHRVALERGAAELKSFTLPQTREKDLQLFCELSGRPAPRTIDDIPISVAIPAFMISELTTSFQMGLTIFIPLLVIDLLVSAVLMSLGMMMVPPQMISLPVKLGVFLLADGWHLVVAGLAQSFRV